MAADYYIYTHPRLRGTEKEMRRPGSTDRVECAIVAIGNSGARKEQELKDLNILAHYYIYPEVMSREEFMKEVDDLAMFYKEIYWFYKGESGKL